MRYFCAVLCLFAGVVFGQDSASDEAVKTSSNEDHHAKLVLSISNFESTVGRVFISIYNNSDTFLGKEKFQKRELVVADAIVDGKVSTAFDLPVGEYAVAVFHDDNDNGKMDSNFIGIPNEPSGLSNGHVPKFGPPRYKEAKFQLTAEGELQEIKLD